MFRAKALDDSTGCGVGFGQVVVDNTRCSTYTDTLGSFVLEGVPVRAIGVDACADGGVAMHIETQAPVESLVIRLRGLPRYRFARSCR